MAIDTNYKFLQATNKYNPQNWASVNPFVQGGGNVGGIGQVQAVEQVKPKEQAQQQLLSATQLAQGIDALNEFQEKYGVSVEDAYAAMQLSQAEDNEYKNMLKALNQSNKELTADTRNAYYRNPDKFLEAVA